MLDRAGKHLYFQLLRRACLPGIMFLDGVYTGQILKPSFAPKLCLYLEGREYMELNHFSKILKSQMILNIPL